MTQKLPKQYQVQTKAAVVNNNSILENAVIHVEDGIIQRVDQNLNESHLVDWSDSVALPGLTNAHCHLELTEDKPLTSHDFVKWLNEIITYKKKQTNSQKKANIQKGIQKLKESGVTTIIDHVSFDTPFEYYNHHDVNLILVGEVLGSLRESSQKALNTFLNEDHIHQSPHTTHTLHPQSLKDTLNKKSKFMSVHLAESQDEMTLFQTGTCDYQKLLKELFNQDIVPSGAGEISPFQYLKKINPNTKIELCVHANFLGETDLKILKEWKSCVVHCPGSYEFFGHGNFDYQTLKKQGIPIALGTDGSLSNKTLSMQHEIRLFLKDNPMDLFELLPLITTNALEAIGIDHIGKISEGYHCKIAGLTCDSVDSEAILHTILKNDSLQVFTS